MAMTVSIFGLGYVGCVSLGCLAKNGFSVIGVDVEQHKVDMINQGLPTIVEKDIDILISEGHAQGKLRATTDVRDAVLNSEISIICVGTPSRDDGALNLTYMERVAEAIGQALQEKDTFHIVVIRSTVPPGTNHAIGDIIARESGKVRNQDFAMVSNPEFLRESTAVEDYFNPPYTLLGSDCQEALDKVAMLYEKVGGEVHKSDLAVAEIMKYINNSFHALKITFANEVGNICRGLEIDSHQVMSLFCKDTRLNISPYYMKPGFAYGGSCLPKDLKALANLAHNMHLETPVLSHIHASNEFQKEKVLQDLLKLEKRKIGILGLSFKAGTDDLRESPIVDVVERLLGKGFDIKIHDANVQVSKLTGANKSYIENKLPHLSALLTDLDDVLNHAEVLVIATKEAEYKRLFQAQGVPAMAGGGASEGSVPIEGKVVYDLVRITEQPPEGVTYVGICW